MIIKYGNNGLSNIRNLAGFKGGSANKGKLKLTEAQILERCQSLVQYDQTKRGWISKAAINLKLSHTQIIRFANQHKDLIKSLKWGCGGMVYPTG